MKIPRVFFQTSILKPPNYLIERIKSKISGWEYKHFLDEDIIEFIKKNPIDEFTDSLEVFHSLKVGAHKADFFRYYYIYVKGGVFLDSDAVLEKNLNDIIQDDCEFFTVQSYMKNNSMFNGFIGAIPKNPIIYQALKHIHMEDKEKINTQYFSICKELYTIIENYNQITDFISDNNQIKIQKIKIFKEEIVDEKIAVTKDSEEIILTHYYNKEYFIPSLIPIPKKIIQKKKPIKIGITLNLHDQAIKLFSNGIHQNTLYLGELLVNLGYDVSFIATDKNLALCEEKEYKKIFYLEKFKVTKHSEILSNNFDVIFVIGYEIQLNILKILKYMNTKIIFYACGNSYFIDSEKILYDQHKSIVNFPYTYKKDAKLYDQIWSIPQMYHTNKSYFETLYRTECIEVPFIWSSKSISLITSCYGVGNEEDLLYIKKNNTKKIVIFEPNISIMKWCFPALLICENAYRQDNDKMIERVFLNNIVDKNETINQFNIDFLNKIVKSLDLFADNKISIESRYNTLDFMKKHADIAVSHQMHNPLNYLYLDLAWMGWPIIHNAHLCKDVGYYYENFDYDMGGKILNEVILNHDSKKDEYLVKNRKVIDRYLPSNKELQKKYKKLVENLFLDK
jgi:hypothetical protein